MLSKDRDSLCKVLEILCRSKERVIKEKVKSQEHLWRSRDENERACDDEKESRAILINT